MVVIGSFNVGAVFNFNEIQYEIFGEGSHISTNQRQESTVFSLLIGRNVRPFPENFVLYCLLFWTRDLSVLWNLTPVGATAQKLAAT